MCNCPAKTLSWVCCHSAVKVRIKMNEGYEVVFTGIY